MVCGTSATIVFHKDIQLACRRAGLDRHDRVAAATTGRPYLIACGAVLHERLVWSDYHMSSEPVI